MTNVRPSTGLQTLFAIFLGLMVTAFIGVGVYTFYPSPREQYQRQTTELDRDEQAIRNAVPPSDLTPAHRSRLQEIQDQRNKTQDAGQLAFTAWGRTTSIVLILFATIAMAVSLVRADQLPVISNGLLMGGVFTMLYGVGWIIATDTSIARFVVMSVALGITITLGYLRFVRVRTATAGLGSVAATAAGSPSELERRVRQLEQRLDDAARALRGGGDPA